MRYKPGSGTSIIGRFLFLVPAQNMKADTRDKARPDKVRRTGKVFLSF